MKIGFDFRMGGSINSGIGRYVFEVLKHLITSDDQNEYIVFYNQNNFAEADLAELEKVNRPTLVPTTISHYSLAEQLLLPRILARYNLDLMHFPNFNVPVLYRGKFIVTIHDMVHHKISGHKKSHLLHFQAYKYIIRHAAEKSEKIITVTNTAKKEIMEYLSIPESKIGVIYEAPSLEPANSDMMQKTKDLLLLQRPYFLFVGTMERKKNIVTLAKGFDLFLDKTKLDMDLVLAGKVDWHYPEIKSQALDVKNRNRLVFTDYVENDMLSALYQGAYAFVTASLHEGFGLPGVEAMQFGVPILASNTAVFNEVYDNAAIYFDPTDPKDIAEKMALITRDILFHRSMQEKSLQRGTVFDWAEAAKQTLKVYEEVLHG